MVLKKKVALVALASLMITPMSFAAKKGTLLLKGKVAKELALTVTPEAGHDSLDLSASPASLKVATVNELSNSNSGYKIDLKSANGGTLNNGSLDSLAYEVSYDGGAFLSLTTADQGVKSQATAGVYNYDSDVAVKYTGKPAATMVQGTYKDTLTFTISAI